MSNPMAGRVRFDAQELERLQRQREKEERKELEALEKERNKATRLEEAKERRLAQLREREERRARREEARAQARAEAAARERQFALAAYQKRVAALEAALAARSSLRDTHPGIDLPEVPELGEEPAGDAEAVRSATSDLEIRTRAYQRQLDDSLSRWNAERAAGQAVEDARARLSSFRALPVCSAQEVIAALGEPSSWAAEAGSDADRNALATKARGLVSGAASEGLEVLSVATLDALESVVSATTPADARVELQRLIEALEGDKRAAQIERDQSAAVESERLAREAADEAERRRHLLTQELRSALEDLNYVVGDVEQGAGLDAGNLVALKRDWPDHGLRMTVRSTGDLDIEAVRLKRTGAPAVSAADRAAEVDEDTQFDESTCGESGSINDFIDAIRRKKMEISVRQTFLPGTNELSRVPVAALSEPAVREYERWHSRRNDDGLKQRARDPKAP